MAESHHGRGKECVNPNLRVERYRRSRFWAVYVNDELLAVTVYKKGALAVREMIGGESERER